MQKISVVFLSFILMVNITGCAHYSTDFKALTATSIKDLEKARKTGEEKTFSADISTVFSEVKDILKRKTLTIYQEDPDKKYIIAMGFNRQIDTTRVGIFFDEVSANETKVTLSSLSSNALEKAAGIIFPPLRKALK